MDLRLLSEAAQMRVSKKGGEAMMQADELRKMAVNLGVNGVCTGDLSKLYVMLNKAAETIKNLQDSINEVADRWASEKIKAEDYARENMMLKANNGSRWFELFGTPERVAQTMMKIFAMCNKSTIYCAKCPLSKAPACYGNDDGDYDAFLEWLRGDTQ